MRKNSRSRLDRLAAAGLTYREIAGRLGVSWWAAYLRARRSGAAPRCRHLSAATRAEIVRQLLSRNASYAEIAASARVSKPTVARIAADLRSRQANRAGSFAPERLNVPRRCPRHGALRVWPCVACAAEAEAARRR